jgi:hypothetical protein
MKLPGFKVWDRERRLAICGHGRIEEDVWLARVDLADLR